MPSPWNLSASHRPWYLSPFGSEILPTPRLAPSTYWPSKRTEGALPSGKPSSGTHGFAPVAALHTYAACLPCFCLASLKPPSYESPFG